MVKRFKLKNPGEKGDIESYLERGLFYDFDPREMNSLKYALFNNVAPTINRDWSKMNKSLYDKIKRNPKDYFNFGFNMKDFNFFVFKHLFMRLERGIIKHKVDEFKMKNKMKLKEKKEENQLENNE